MVVHFPITLPALNILSLLFDKSNGCTEVSTERPGCAAIAHSNTHITRTITVDEGLTIVRSLGKETPALIYHRVSSWKNDVYL